jgi:hypothetical protein
VLALDTTRYSANDLPAAISEYKRRAVMRAMRANSMKVSVDARQQNLCAIRRHLFHFAVDKFTRLATVTSFWLIVNPVVKLVFLCPLFLY